MKHSGETVLLISILLAGCQHTNSENGSDLEKKDKEIARLKGEVESKDYTITKLDDALVHASLSQIHNLTIRHRGTEPDVVIGELEVYADNYKAPYLRGNVLVIQNGKRRRVRATCRECLVSGNTLVLKRQPLLVVGGWHTPHIYIGTSHGAEFILDSWGFAQKGTAVKRRIHPDRNRNTLSTLW